MMILDACNNSAVINIECSEKALTNIPLNYFPGENISDLSTTSIRHIKVMRGMYPIPPKLGTNLLLKVWKTSGDIFNRSILNYYADTDETETKYYIKYPSIMENYNSYAKYVPVGSFGYLQDKY